VNGPLEVNITGRLMLMLSQLGVKDACSLSIYIAAVNAVVERRARTEQAINLGNLEPFLVEQLDMLATALKKSREVLNIPGLARVPAAEMESTVPDEDLGTTPRRPSRPASGYVPVAKSMEEKLKDDRKPVQKLLLEDCVAEHLLDVSKARELIAGMSGKTPQNAEHEIVEYLRTVLQSQVKRFIRSDKGGPWAKPHAQEELRKDIHAANSVRGVLTLCRQIVKEHQVWEQEHGHAGILGLFSPRRRSHGA
jgi:hypothetical protein